MWLAVVTPQYTSISNRVFSLAWLHQTAQK
jgi:hypothetical protein